MKNLKLIIIITAVILAFYAISQLPDGTKEYGTHVCEVTKGNADCK